MNSNLLLSRVLKSVYFSTTSLLHSNGWGRTSWGRQTLMLGRDLILPGIRWQLGTGVQVDVLEIYGFLVVCVNGHNF
ncbi:hypothetical protein LINPERHAP2_LOCUS19489 [Linum perenne]